MTGLVASAHTMLVDSMVVILSNCRLGLKHIYRVVAIQSNNHYILQREHQGSPTYLYYVIEGPM